jgi:L-Ala-D/L-Glu epimerase
MQIVKAEVIPIELGLKHPYRTAVMPEIRTVTAIFIRLETRQGQSAWGCTVAHPEMTGERPEDVILACQECANLAPDLHPLHIEYSLDQLSTRMRVTPAVLCAFDLAFHDLLGLSAGMPLFRILGGFRDRIQTSVTIPLGTQAESVDQAELRASQGFRMLKIKGGLDPEEDVRRVQAIHHALPYHTLRLDVDGGYTIQEALDVARTLGEVIEMFEQPSPPGDLEGLSRVRELSPVPVLADQSVTGPASALKIAANHFADGVSIKLASCGGLRCARQVDAIARAAHIATMIGCFVEPALLISAGLSLALSSPNIHYADLDGFLDLSNDPSRAGFQLTDGWLIASDVPGLGYSIELG